MNEYTAKMKIKIQRAKRSKLGRGLCRLAGDKTGAVMMEYVILAVLIAAAAVVAVAVFGKSIVNMFGVAGKGATGDHSGAATEQQAAQGEQDTGSTDAKKYHDDMHK